MRTIATTAVKVRPGDVIATGPTRTLFDRYATETVASVTNHGDFIDIFGDAGLIGPNGTAPDQSVYVKR